MKNFLPPFRSFLRRKEAAGNSPLSTEVIRELDNNIKRKSRESQKSGWRGVADCRAQIEQFSAEIDQVRTKVLKDFQAKKARLETRLTHLKDSIAGFDFEKEKKRQLNQSHGERAELENDCNAQIEAYNKMKHEAEIEQSEAGILLEEHETRYGQVSDKSWTEFLPLLILIVSGLADVPFTFQAAVSLGFAPLAAMGLGIAFAGFLAASGHFFGKLLFKGSLWLKVLSGLSGVAMIATIASLRYGSSAFTFTLLVLSLFWAMGVLTTYLHSRKAEGYILRDRKRKAGNDILAIDAHLNLLNGEKDGLDTTYGIQAENKADAYYTKLTRELESNRSMQVENQSKLTEAEAMLNAIARKGVARIQEAFAQGAARRYRGGGSASAKAAVVVGFLIAAVGFSGCSQLEGTEAVIQETAFFLDKSGSMLQDPNLKAEACRYAFGLSGLDGGGYVRDGTSVHLYPFGDVSIPEKLSATLPVGQPYALASIPERDTAVQRFKAEVEGLFDKAFSLADTLRSTNLHRATAHGFSRLMQSSSTQKNAVVVSDFIEEGYGVVLSGYTAAQIRMLQDTLIDQLLSDAPLPELSGLRIDIVLVSNAASPAGENLSYRCAELFKTLWERKGAQVSLQRNF